MIRATTIQLLRESPAAHGIFDAPIESPEEVFAEVMTASQNEYYKALSNGLEVELVFRLTDYADYHGEKVLLYGGNRFRVIRTYIENEAIYIVTGRATTDA